MAPKEAGKGTGGSEVKVDKRSDVLSGNCTAAKDLADLLRTSLGPRGMDKMIVEPKGDITVTNDGATVLQKVDVTHPCAQILKDLSKAQDIEVGDGTTSVIVTVGALLKAVEEFLENSIHPSKINKALTRFMAEVETVLKGMAKEVTVEDREKMIQAARTSLSSKVVAAFADTLAPMAVDSVRRVYVPPTNPNDKPNVDLRKIKIVKCLGGTVEDTELVNGMILAQRASRTAGGPTSIKGAKVALLQFQLSPPKTDMENSVMVKEFSQMDRLAREERQYILSLCKDIRATGANVVLIQKSILRDAVTDQSLAVLAKMKMMVVRDVERTDVDFICSSLGCTPIASRDGLQASKLGTAERVEEVATPSGKVVKFLGLPKDNTSPCTTVLIRGGNELMLEEADRSFHDALCVVRSLYKESYLLSGGGAAETELSVQIGNKARDIEGTVGYCMRKFAQAMEVIPYTLAENAGLRPVEVTASLRKCHLEGQKTMGINVRKGKVTDMEEENVVQPLLVTLSAVKLAVEAVSMILRVDDIVPTRG